MAVLRAVLYDSCWVFALKDRRGTCPSAFTQSLGSAPRGSCISGFLSGSGVVTSKTGPVMPAVYSGGVPGQHALWQLVSYRLLAEACISEMQRKAVL